MKVDPPASLIDMTKPVLRTFAPDTKINVAKGGRPPNAQLCTREYLTEREVDQLIDACTENRYPLPR